jgi:tetratricopeptide (TPR) repeat protein
LPGCASGPDRRLVEAMSVRQAIAPDYRTAISVLEEYRANLNCKPEYVLYGMSATAVAVCAGNYRDAERIGHETYVAFKKYEDASAETRAAWGNEAIKFFKGEPHERSMLAWYLGLTAYVRGEYNDARVFFMQSLLSAATRDEDMKDFRDDFQLGHYWLGRAYLKLGDESNARVAFQKAAASRLHRGQERETDAIRKRRAREYQEELRQEAVTFREASGEKKPVTGAVDLSKAQSREGLPPMTPNASAETPVRRSAATLEAFLDPAFQREVNLVVVVELGLGPRKYLAGTQNERDEVAWTPYKERIVEIYIDGHQAGQAFCLCDMYHQAVTRGVQTRRGRQTGKVIAKEILRRMPYVGGIFAYWDIAGDARCVPVLPGEVHVFGAQVGPGCHTVALQCSDASGNLLPRYAIERHFIPVPADGERVLVMQTKENQDNDYLLEQAASAAAQAK